MPVHRHPILAAAVLLVGLVFPLPSPGETAAEVQQRLDQYRQRDANAAQEKAKLEAEAEQRRVRTRLWQKQRQRENYARRWRCYGADEIDLMQWRQEKDGTWVTVTKPASGLAECLGVLVDPPWVPDSAELGTRPNSIPGPQVPAASLPRAGLTVPASQWTPRLRRDPSQLERAAAPLRYNLDQSIDQLVRDGVVTPAERDRRRGLLQPLDVGTHLQACRTGALSARECSSGVVFLGRGRLRPGELGSLQDRQALAALGADGGAIGAMPLPPISVPVSALLAGAGGSFRLSDVFRVTPRPQPVLGNNNVRLLYPLIGASTTSSPFGWRLHPVLGSWLMHAGRDLAAPEGTPVVAALSGRVVSSGLAGGYGLAVEVQHERPSRRTLYGHLSELYVKEGEWVKQGEVIGRVGSTGLSTGPHLHFELRLPQGGGWVAMDPGELDPSGGLLPTGSGSPDAVALLMGQLLASLERPRWPLAPGGSVPSPGAQARTEPG